jgi:hypothetical protein
MLLAHPIGHGVSRSGDQRRRHARSCRPKLEGNSQAAVPIRTYRRHVFPSVGPPPPPEIGPSRTLHSPAQQQPRMRRFRGAVVGPEWPGRCLSQKRSYLRHSKGRRFGPISVMSRSLGTRRHRRPLPPEVVAETAARYREAFPRLTASRSPTGPRPHPCLIGPEAAGTAGTV